MALLQRAAVALQCSRKEGWGLTVIESNAVGTPVVACDAPGLRDSVEEGKTGFLVGGEGADLVAAVADRLAQLLGDDARAAEMSATALAWSRRFDWDRAADEMADALAAAARGR